MDLKRMYALKNLQADVDERFERMQRIYEIATKTTSSVGGGSNGTVVDRVGKCATEIECLRAEIEELNGRCIDELVFLQRYADQIDDVVVRRIISLRFMDGLSWGAIARRIGGNNTAESVRKIATRYLRAH